MTAAEGPDVLIGRQRRWLLYAERGPRRLVQLVADVVVVAWVIVGVSLAVALHDLVLTLQAPGRGLVDAGGRVTGVFGDAAGVAGRVPFVGDDLAGALGGGTNAGQSLVDAGNQQIAAVAAVATGLAWLLVVVAVLPVVAVWVVLRVRWVLRARQALLARSLDVDLLALRALTRASPARLARATRGGVPGGPGGLGDAWRQAEPRTLLRLADVELGRLGLRGPDAVAGRRPPERWWRDG